MNFLILSNTPSQNSPNLSPIEPKNSGNCTKNNVFNVPINIHNGFSNSVPIQSSPSCKNFAAPFMASGIITINNELRYPINVNIGRIIAFPISAISSLNFFQYSSCSFCFFSFSSGDSSANTSGNLNKSPIAFANQLAGSVNNSNIPLPTLSPKAIDVFIQSLKFGAIPLIKLISIGLNTAPKNVPIGIRIKLTVNLNNFIIC